MSVARASGNNIKGDRARSVGLWAWPEGGTITEAGGYRYHTFFADDTFVMRSPLTVEYLVIGGGGGGGAGGANVGGAGGGAGGYVTTAGQLFSQGSYPITIATGVAADTNGLASSISNLYIAEGGGAGGGASPYAGTGQGGGSGGGSSGANKAPGSGITGKGHAGGQGTGTYGSTFCGGGGGGGAGGIGGASPNTNSPSLAGIGMTWGNGITYATGGVGAKYSGSLIGTSGAAYTGNGGAGGEGAGGAGGAGGSGVVIIRYVA